MREIATAVLCEYWLQEWKKACDRIAEMCAEWIEEFMEKDYQSDLRCILYAYMINKSRGGKE